MALALVADLGVWIHGANRTLVTCPGSCSADPLQSVWFLGLTPYSLLHGHTPLYTDVLSYPVGVNLMANTGMSPLGLLGLPVTLLFGSAATLNTMVVLALAASALTAFLVFRGWVAHPLAAYIGALAFGFGPYASTQARAHLDLTVTVFPLLAFWLLHRLVSGQARSPWKTGLVLGVASAVQLLISAEILATSALLGGIGLVLLALANRTEARARASEVLKALAATAVGFLVLAAYPLWMLFAGPQHLSAAVQPPAAVAPLSTDLLGSVVPTANQLIDPGFAHGLAHHLTLASSVSEDGAYLGIGMLAVLAWLCVRRRGMGLVRWAAVMVLISLIFSMGSQLTVAGHGTSLPMPFRYLLQLPLFTNVVASRFSLYTDLFTGLLLAVAVDSLWPDGIRFAPVPCAVAAAALIPMLPSWPFPTSALPLPAFFTTSAVDQIPAGSTVLTYPYPVFPEVQAMAWQSLDGMRYRLPSGYAFIPGPDHTVVHSGSPYQVGDLLQQCLGGGPAPQVPPQERAVILSELGYLQISTVVVTNAIPGEHCASAFFTALLGRPPQVEHGVLVWLDA